MALEAPADFVEGSAEPWVVDVVCALLKASDQRNVLECGTFIGATTQRLVETVAQMGAGSVVGVEFDLERARTTQARLEATGLPNNWQIVQQDILGYIASQPDTSIGFVWVDDDHATDHVSKELELLIPKMVSGGIITGHDVYGSTDLQEVFAHFGGYSLDLPRLGPAGGLGILQVR